jgi:hypothetical protein
VTRPVFRGLYQRFAYANFAHVGAHRERCDPCNRIIVVNRREGMRCNDSYGAAVTLSDECDAYAFSGQRNKSTRNRVG